MQLRRVPAADAFLILRTRHARQDSSRDPVNRFFAELHQLVGLGRTYDVIDERLHADGRCKELTIKFLADICYAPMASAIAQLLADQHCQWVQAQFVAALDPAEITLRAHDYTVEHFRREGAIDSGMVVHLRSCVKLVHHASGTEARSTSHRNRDWNLEEALQLLAALVRNHSLLVHAQTGPGRLPPP